MSESVSLDWDLLSRKPRKHAINIEKRIDKAMGCSVPIPMTSVYRVTTSFTDKELESQYKKATRGLMVPFHYFTYEYI